MYIFVQIFKVILLSGVGKIIQTYEKELIIKEYQLEMAKKFIVDHFDDVKIGK